MAQKSQPPKAIRWRGEQPLLVRVDGPSEEGSEHRAAGGRAASRSDEDDRPPTGGLVSNLPIRERLSRLARTARGKKQALILTHDNPDPDALASAVALAHLFRERFGVPTRIAYGGIVGRAENRAMIRVLHLPVIPVSRVVFEDYDLLALVDTQPSVGNHSLPPHLQPHIVFDHHPPRDESMHVPFADLGHGYGATCTLLLEYLREAHLPLNAEVATALFYGIKADTRDLGRQTYPVDIDSYIYLLPQMDKEALERIEHPALPARYFKLYNNAIERALVHGNAVEVDLGEIYSPDMVAEVAERLLALEGMRWSVAYGSYRDQLFLSVRTKDKRKNAGRLIRQICADLGGSAGGHGTMAGARLPLTGRRRQREQLKRQLIRRFLTEFGCADTPSQPLLALDEQSARG